MLRTIESFELEGTFKGHLVQLPCNLQLNQVLRAPSSPTLNISKDGTSTTSLGNLNQCLTTPIKEAFFPCIQSKSLLFQFKSIFALSHHTDSAKESVPFLIPPSQVCSQVSWSLPFCRLHSPALSLSSQGGVPSLGSFLWPSGRSPTAPCLSCTEHSPSGRSAPGEVSQHRAEGQIPSLTLLATLLWMQPRIPLAGWAVRTQCWLMFSCHSSVPPRPFHLQTENSLRAVLRRRTWWF